jgi:hypothetical protein
MSYFHRIVLVVILAVSFGCTGAVTAADNPVVKPAESKPLPPWLKRFAKGKPAKSIPDAGKLYTLKVGTWSFETIDAHDRAKTVLLKVYRHEKDKLFPWRRRTPDGRIEHIGQAKDGAWVIHATEDLKFAATTVYDPPFPLLPAKLEPGKSVTTESKMTVHDRNNPKVIKDRGTCTRTLTAQSIQMVTTRAGQFECYRIASSITAKLGLADVTTQSVVWYVADRGPIAAYHHEKVQTKLFIGWQTTERLMLRQAKPLPEPEKKTTETPAP